MYNHLSKYIPSLPINLDSKFSEWKNQFAARYGRPPTAYDKERWNEQVYREILMPYLREIQNLDQTCCRIHGHTEIVYNTQPSIGLQKSSQKTIEENGLYIYHYLFECFQRTKKVLKAKTVSEKNEENAKVIETQINVYELRIKKLKHQLYFMKNAEQLERDAKESSFVRKRPETYHRAVKHLFDIDPFEPTNKRAKTDQ